MTRGVMRKSSCAKRPNDFIETLRAGSPNWRLQSSTLPVGPCQTIYRSIFSQIRTRHHATASPFKYVEVDWNTEGLPRGPQGSFVSPHFDFHFYTRQKSWIDKHLRCGTANGTWNGGEQTRAHAREGARDAS